MNTIVAAVLEERIYKKDPFNSIPPYLQALSPG